ncbi:hypothetical protein, partial [Salmonella enterica]|uniref:hypothetical protein n=1 Tax=Salmonella enterica TaxID=28901 RepID=UPI001F32843B
SFTHRHAVDKIVMCGKHAIRSRQHTSYIPPAHTFNPSAHIFYHPAHMFFPPAHILKGLEALCGAACSVPGSVWYYMDLFWIVYRIYPVDNVNKIKTGH